MKKKHFKDRPTEVSFGELRYEVTPELVTRLTWAHRTAGSISAMRFSHYGGKRVETDAHRRRITYGVMRAGHKGVTLDDVNRLLAGDLLPPRKSAIETIGRKVAVLMEAARQLGRGEDPSSPETFATYLDFLQQGTALWSRFVGLRKEKVLESHQSTAKASPQVLQLYKWIDDDPLVVQEPILRAATLYWGLSLLHRYPHERPAIDAVVHHELKTGFIDSRGLLVLSDSEFGERAQQLGGIITSKADYLGDLTQYYEHYAFELARALGELRQRLNTFQDKEDRLPWLMARPPDELDRQIFDIIEKLGSARSQEILQELRDPPPLRTLQRRLQRLAKGGLIAKQGSRKFAYYRLAEHQ